MCTWNHLLDPDFYADRPANFDTRSVHETGINPGERYWAKRNGPGQVLTCRVDDLENGWVRPEGLHYPFNRTECFRELVPAG